jgi:hypothetical protein
MGWEHDDYSVLCTDCGNSGSIRFSSDDWNRFEVRADGFAVVRGYHMNPAGSILRCLKCNGTNTKIGGYTP